jgi:hypothetical protein
MNHLAENGARPVPGGNTRPAAARDDSPESELLRQENEQLRGLCAELEQALQEASNRPALTGSNAIDDRFREYEALLEEKSEMIRQLHQQLQHAMGVVADLEGQVASAPEKRVHTGPTPREEELLALSEELERDRRQLQEDEETLMQQMREMEVSMARERAEMARQRNDLQRLHAEIRHELERLERNGAIQSKIEGLKNKLNDATTRRGMAPSGAGAVPTPPEQPQQQPGRKDNLLGRLFGR